MRKIILKLWNMINTNSNYVDYNCQDCNTFIRYCSLNSLFRSQISNETKRTIVSKVRRQGKTLYGHVYSFSCRFVAPEVWKNLDGWHRNYSASLSEKLQFTVHIKWTDQSYFLIHSVQIFDSKNSSDILLQLLSLNLLLIFF